MNTILITALVFLSSAGARANGSWDELKNFIHLCAPEQKNKKSCIQEITKLLEGEILWGDIGFNYQRGKKEWRDVKLKFDFDAPAGEEGDFQIARRKEKLFPHISLSEKSDPYELLITLNHEIVHFANSKELKNLFGKNEKLHDCITAFQLSMLKNEKLAYLSEIYFWKTAPEWFKNEQKRMHFNSKMLGTEKITYVKYYSVLETELVRDPQFAAKRYIELGKFPKCAEELLIM